MKLYFFEGGRNLCFTEAKPQKRGCTSNFFVLWCKTPKMATPTPFKTGKRNRVSIEFRNLGSTNTSKNSKFQSQGTGETETGDAGRVLFVVPESGLKIRCQSLLRSNFPARKTDPNTGAILFWGGRGNREFDDPVYMLPQLRGVKT